MDTIRIYQAQTRVPADKKDALDIAAAAVADAADRGADLAALPEMFCCPYDTKNFPLYAEEEGGPVWTRCAELARTHGIYLSAGTMPERGRDGKVYNTAFVFDREGRPIARHRKMHLFEIGRAHV